MAPASTKCWCSRSEAWVWFRFGASSLANDILMQLQKEADGRYQSADYFSLD